ncbi:MAG: hypothetical protein AB9Q22_08600 [Candidatus Reddybacter sp.]
MKRLQEIDIRRRVNEVIGNSPDRIHPEVQEAIHETAQNIGEGRHGIFFTTKIYAVIVLVLGALILATNTYLLKVPIIVSIFLALLVLIFFIRDIALTLLTQINNAELYVGQIHKTILVDDNDQQ